MERNCSLDSKAAMVETQEAPDVNVVRRFAILETPALLRPIRVRTPPARTLTEQNRSLGSQIAVGIQEAIDVNVVRRAAIQDNNALLRPIRVRTPPAQTLMERNHLLGSQIAVGIQ